MFECLKCKKRQIFYEDGSPWDYEKPKCKNCNVELKTKYSKKKDVLTITTCCPKCSFKEVDVLDSKKRDAERKKEEERKQALMKEYRAEFCLDDIEGPKAVQNLDAIVAFSKELKEREKKEKDPVFQKAKKLNKLTFNQLKELISKTIAPEGYIDLQFGRPEMGRYVIVEFSASDSKDDREEYDSTHTLKKIINAALTDTSWRLMSEGIHYRLGIVSGRFKAYEHEDDLMSIVHNN